MSDPQPDINVQRLANIIVGLELPPALDDTDARLAATLEQMVQEYVKVIGEMQAALAHFRDRAESLEHSLIEQTLECSRLRDSLNAREAELKELRTEADQLWRQAKGRWAMDRPRIERIQQEWRFGQTIRTDDMDWIVEQFRSAPLVVPSRAAASLTEEQKP